MTKCSPPAEHFLCHRQPLMDRRVAVEEEHVEPVRIGIVLVQLGQLAKGREIGVFQAGPLQGVAVALALETPADRVLQRLQEQCQRA